MNFSLRPFTRDDQSFLFQLYVSTRQDELLAFGWTTAQQEAFLRMQFNAQQQWYEMAYPGADHQIILVDGQPVGRILVFRESGAYRLVDIALLSEHRSRGMGTELLHQLIAKSQNQGLPLRLQVLKTNRARQLYQRLGFQESGDDGMYYQMEKRLAGS